MQIVFYRQEFKLGSDLRKHILHGKDFVARPPVSFERHKFNKTNLDRNMGGPADKIIDFVFIETFHHHHIYFYFKPVMQ